MKVSIIIPTLQAEKYLPTLLASMRQQSLLPAEIIVIDSSSTDATVRIARQEGCRVEVIPRKSFRHGRARNLGARLAHGDVLVFLTQDALPEDDCFLERLVKPILSGSAAAVTGCQVPYPDANPIERFSRRFNYPAQPCYRSQADIPRLGIKTFFFSDSASAVERQIFQAVGGFSEHLIVNEDMELCARLVRSGCTVCYQAEARIFHSHNYSHSQLMGRYFDIGVFFSQGAEVLKGVSPNGEGKRYVAELIQELVRTGDWVWIPRVISESGVKFISFHLGSRYRSLPQWAKKRLSGQAYFWE